jgi:hypothetical protein
VHGQQQVSVEQHQKVELQPTGAAAGVATWWHLPLAVVIKPAVTAYQEIEMH